MTIAFTGGGTGGHIYPGLAVSAAVQERLACRIIWLGSDIGLDRGIVESSSIDDTSMNASIGNAGITFFGIPSGKLRRGFSICSLIRNLFDVFRILAGFFSARKVLKREKPRLLFSKGGFVSVPPVIAAASLRIPVFTHESDFSPGLATRINARFSQKIFVAYEGTLSLFKSAYRSKVTVTGNPVRPVFRTAEAARGRAFLGVPEDARILLALGGSQGAREINTLVKDNLASLTGVYTVVHQTGREDWDIPASERYRPFPYIREEMPHLLAASELVLGRSGAGTVWECAVTGKPMALVPLRGKGTRGDQVENAHVFERAGAAITVLDASALVDTVLALAQDEKRRSAMAEAAKTIGSLDGTELIADILCSVCENKI